MHARLTIRRARGNLAPHGLLRTDDTIEDDGFIRECLDCVVARRSQECWDANEAKVDANPTEWRTGCIAPVLVTHVGFSSSKPLARAVVAGLITVGAAKADALLLYTSAWSRTDLPFANNEVFRW